MGLFVDFIMLYNIKPLSLHRVFHGIRFKVNEDWESGKIPFFILSSNPQLSSSASFLRLNVLSSLN